MGVLVLGFALGKISAILGKISAILALGRLAIILWRPAVGLWSIWGRFGPQHARTKAIANLALLCALALWFFTKIEKLLLAPLKIYS